MSAQPSREQGKNTMPSGAGFSRAGAEACSLIKGFNDSGLPWSFRLKPACNAQSGGTALKSPDTAAGALHPAALT